MLSINKQTIIPVAIGVVVAIAVIYVVAHVVVSNRLAELENYTQEQLTDQQALLVAIAETTARNGADVITEQVVKDCSLSERGAFDDLLSRLNQGLSQTELVTLERLFGRCGAFYAERKSVMVARMVREIEIYENLIAQHALITGGNSAERFQIDAWRTLAVEEQKQSQLFTRLVALQDEIITSLLAGNEQSSDSMQSILYEVRETQETLVVASKQASDIRRALTPL